MLALVLDDTLKVQEDFPAPNCAAGEARVAVRLAGVCDTDLQLVKGYMGFSGVPGHEMVGTVLESPSARWIGKRVVADINAGCGKCFDCEKRDGHHCAARSVLGILGRNGAFAQELTVPETCLVEVPDSVSDENAVFAEPLAAALHVLDVAGARDAKRAIVVGDGKLGLLIAAALSTAISDVLVVGHHSEKLALLDAWGARGILESALSPADARADLVVEASGSPSGLTRALSLCKPRGTVVLKTTVAGSTTVDLSPIVIDELTVVGSRCGDLKAAIAHLANGGVDPTALIQARYPLRDGLAAFTHAARRGTLKILIEIADAAD
jgi:threonine dehydrogenase-like Zn-dependent dehydrogenase